MSDLTLDDKAAIAALLRDTIAGDSGKRSARVRRWKAILDKLEPTAPKREPLPPLKPPGGPCGLSPARVRRQRRHVVVMSIDPTTNDAELVRLRAERLEAVKRAEAIQIPLPGQPLNGEQFQRFLEHEKIWSIDRQIRAIRD